MKILKSEMFSNSEMDGNDSFLKSKEIDGYEFDDEDGEIILYKIVFDPYKPSPVSDINGLVKSNVKMVRWNNPYLRMAKEGQE